MTGRDRFRRIRGTAMGAVLELLAWFLGGVSWSRAQWLGRILGRLGWRWTSRERGRTRRHLALAWPDRERAWRERIARGCFEHLGMLLTECLWLSRRDCRAVEEVTQVRGWEEVERARSTGKPILVLTGHCGNWELLAAVISCRGLPLTVMARRLDDPSMNRRALELRSHFGTETIERGTPGAARKLLKTLRAGGALGMLIDQDTEVDGVWVPFFGRLAYTPAGAASLALRRDAVVLPFFIERKAEGDHLVTVHPPLELPEDCEEATALMTRRIEAQVRRCPEQWVWMHRRWRRRPEDEDQPSPEPGAARDEEQRVRNRESATV
ncbi:MAG: lysophospholipid acyltransferase family protein [Thermoanaerobaculia bacterium]|nr:lysophospholipid acyltransferase family protein [Thermoanaerobaculia bacterium]